MVGAGITSVGEFHYLQHDQGGNGYAFDEVVLRAAADAGIRIALLNVFYKTGGIGESLKGGQLRFWTASLDEYWSQLDALTGARVEWLRGSDVVMVSTSSSPSGTGHRFRVTLEPGGAAAAVLETLADTNSKDRSSAPPPDVLHRPHSAQGRAMQGRMERINSKTLEIADAKSRIHTQKRARRAND